MLFSKKILNILSIIVVVFSFIYIPYVFLIKEEKEML